LEQAAEGVSEIILESIAVGSSVRATSVGRTQGNQEREERTLKW
jgi:hypothetical protein